MSSCVRMLAHLEPGLLGHLQRDVGAQHVAGVVQHHQQHAGLAVGQLAAPRSTCGAAGAAKISPDHADVEHALADEAAQGRLMARAAERHQRHLVAGPSAWRAPRSLPASSVDLVGVGQRNSLPAVPASGSSGSLMNFFIAAMSCPPALSHAVGRGLRPPPSASVSPHPLLAPSTLCPPLGTPSPVLQGRGGVGSLHLPLHYGKVPQFGQRKDE